MTTPLGRITATTAALVALCAITLLSAAPARANRFGIITRSGKQGLTCSQCHGGGVEPDVRFIGPESVAPGAVATFTFEVASNIPVQSAGGFNVAASAGQLGLLPDQGAQLGGGELTHTQPKANVDGVARWQFTWTAPNDLGTYTLFGAGNSVNLNNQDSGDRSLATTLAVLVQDATATPTSTPTPAQTSTITPTRAPVPCVGDCDDSGDVSVNELITGVNISLGNRPLSACLDFDRDGSQSVGINELIAAVNSALFTCE